MTSGRSTDEPFGRYELHGFHPHPALSDDEQYLTMCMLVTRSSICAQGHMGCILVSGSSKASAERGKPCSEGNAGATDSQDQYEEKVCRRIIGVATNKPLYSEVDSDVHAEIGAIGEAARRANSTEGCTAYIAMPPCKNCFGALLSAGCRRIVSPRQPNKTVETAAKAEGVEMVTIESGIVDAIRVRIDALVNASNNADDAEKRKAEIAAKRKARKEASKLKKEKRRRLVEENKRIHGEINR